MELQYNQANAFLKSFTNLTTEQVTILFIVYENKKIKQTELRKKLNKDQANLSRIVNRLVDKGLLQTENVTGDLRANLVYITAQGTALIEGMKVAIEKYSGFLKKFFKPEQLRNLHDVLKEFVDIMGNNDDEIKEYITLSASGRGRL